MKTNIPARLDRLPWGLFHTRVVVALPPGQNAPHNLSRDVIEAAIKEQGFQLWRVNKRD